MKLLSPLVPMIVGLLGIATIVSAGDLTYPPELPGGERVVTDRTEEFTKSPVNPGKRFSWNAAQRSYRFLQPIATGADFLKREKDGETVKFIGN